MYRFISDFNRSKIPGSTGQPPWFDLSLADRKTFISKYKKVSIIRLEFKIILQSNFNK